MGINVFMKVGFGRSPRNTSKTSTKLAKPTKASYGGLTRPVAPEEHGGLKPLAR